MQFAYYEMDGAERVFLDCPKRLPQHGDPAAVLTKLSWILCFSFVLRKRSVDLVLIFNAFNKIFTRKYCDLHHLLVIVQVVLCLVHYSDTFIKSCLSTAYSLSFCKLKLYMPFFFFNPYLFIG